MSNIKNLFELYKNQKVLASKSMNDLAPEGEGADWVNSTIKLKNQVDLQIDFSDPANFSRYGSAQQYYTDAFSYIGNEFPYDGSKKEQIEWLYGGSSFDKYIYDNEYPRTTGYINLGVNYGGVGPGGISGYEAPTVDEYISFQGGPHPSNVPNASLSQYFDSHQGAVPDANYYDEDTNQQSNLELNADVGNTAEFWFKKNGWTGDPVESDKQIFVDIWNSASLGGTYGRFRVECDFSITPHQFSVAFQSGTTGGFLDSNLGQLGQNIDLTGSTWNHYAFTFVNNGANLEAKLYLNGELNDSISTGSIGEITGSMLGWIGAMGTTIDTPVTGGLGFAKLSGSMDEFRFWKTKRTSEHIGQYWFTQVGGGTNTDVSENWYAPTKYSYSNPVDLGVYYKFNEGIINTSSVENTDAIILDYSGRITNGAWTGYSVGSRDTGSAMVESSASLAEFKDPILYSYNPLVSTALENLLLKGFNYDINNNASIYNSLPGWIRDDDAVNDRHTLLKLIQVMGSYFDILQLQTERLPRLKDVDYTSSSFKPLPFADRLLESSGLSVGELFSDATELESLANRDDVLNFAEKLDDTKNRIYKNIYNNLVYIFKSKGAEKSIRNLIRCYGVGEELIKLNLYGDEVTYDIKENYVSTITRKEYANFNTTSSWEATVFQTSSTSDASSLSYISSSADQIYRGQTFQLESLFPKQVSPDNISWWSTPFLTSSLGGCHTPSATESDLTWLSPDTANFQIYAIRPAANDKDAKFMLSSSTGGVFPTLTSSLQKDVYENSRWNIAVKVKPTNYQWPNVVLGSTPTTYDVEFIGYNNILDSTDNSFRITGTMSYADGQSFLSSSKRMYVGAHRTNFTGSVLERSDTKISSVRYWMDYLEDSTILAHAKDPSNFGRKHPGENTFLNQPGNLFSEEVTKVPEIETLALQWDFSQVTGSDALGQFFVGDFSSGSTSAAAPYGAYGDLVKIKHPGKGFSFPAINLDATVREFVYTAKQDSPEVINSSDMVQIRNDEDIEIFTRDTRPIRFFFTIEKSMNAIISAEMIKLFATVIDFNNLIGEPVNRYRQDYKSLEKMRQLFFERVQNSTMDFEKFVDYFKWIDDSMGKMVTQLFPASANFSPKVFSMIESHVLERNKYWNKFPTLEMDAKDPEAGLYGINEMMYPYKRGKAPIPLSQTSSCVWAHERAKAETFSSGNPIIDSQRNTFREANDWRPNSTPPTLTDIAGVTPVQYEGSTYALKNFTKPYRFKAKIMPELKGGTNVSKIKNLQYAHTELPFGVSTKLTISSSQVEDDIDCDDIINPNDKVKLRYKLTNNPISYASGDGDIFAPFDLYSSSVTTGYASAIPPMGATPKQIDLRNYHNDVYGGDYEIPVQGPFTEKYVGGREYRHVPFWTPPESRPEAWNLTTQEEFSNTKSFVWTSPLGPSTAKVIEISDTNALRSRSGSWTVSLWFKNAYAGGTFLSRINEIGGWPSAGADWQLLIHGSGDLWMCIYTDINPAGTCFQTPCTQTNDGDWHLLVFGYDESEEKIWADIDNGTFTTELSIAGEIPSGGVVGDCKIGIGCTWNGGVSDWAPSSRFRGTMDEVGIWGNKALDATEISEIWNTGCPTSLKSTSMVSSLVSWYRMGDLPGDNSTPITGRIGDVMGVNNGTPYNTDEDEIVEDVTGSSCGSMPAFLALSPRTTHQARSTILREPLAKRPVNIRNIKQTTGSTIIGNYSQEYEVVQTSGRKINNRFFVKNGGFVPTYAASPWTEGLVDYGLPDFSKFGATKNIFVERFNAPGGPDVSSRGVLDLYAEEYAIRNELNQRNMVVRAPLNEWSTEHCGPFGIDPTGSPGDGTTPEQHAVRACCYTGTIGAYFKVNRNPKTLGALVGTSSTELTTSIQYDNWFVQHQIPRSELQYSWINASYDNTKAQPSGLLGSGDGGRSNFTVPSGTVSTTAPMVQFTPSGSAYAFRSKLLDWDGSSWVPHYPSCEPQISFFNSSSVHFGLVDESYPYTRHYLQVGGPGTVEPGPFGPDGSETEAFSISLWMRVTSSHSHPRVLMSRWKSVGGGPIAAHCDWKLFIERDTGILATANRAVLSVMDSGGTEQSYTASLAAADLVDNQWHHIAATFASSIVGPPYAWSMNVSVDADIKAKTPIAGISGRTTTVSSSTYIGAQKDKPVEGNAYYAFYDGWIDDVSFWYGELADAEITEIYNSGCPSDLEIMSFTPESKELQAWWRMGDAYGDSVDASVSGYIANVYTPMVGSYDAYAANNKFMEIEEEVPDAPCTYDTVVGGFTASLDFVGLNTYINDPIVESQNLLSSSDSDYENRAFAYLCPRINPARDMLHALLLHRDGPYQYPSWKQIRTGETAIARYQKNNNIITVGSKDKILLTPLEKADIFAADSSFPKTPNWYKDSGSTAYYTEPPVTFKYNPLTTGLINQNPSLADGVARNSIPPVMIRNTFSNNLSFCANYGLTEDLGLGDYNTQTRRFGRTPQTQMHDLLRQQYQRNPDKFKFLKYSEWNYPRQIYTGLAENRGRTNYAETASVDFNGFAIASYGSNGIDRNSTYRRTFWKDDWLTRNRKLETLQEFGDNGNLLTGNFDFRTTLSSSLGYTDGWASSIWPMGTNKTFHNTASSDTLILATTYTSKTGGDFGELTRLNYDNLISVFGGEIIPSSSLYLSGNNHVGNVTCPITASNSLVNFTDTSCGAQTIDYVWYGGGLGPYCCGWNHALWDTSSAQTYLGSASCPGGEVLDATADCYGCDFTTGIYTLYTVGNIGHYTFQPSGTIAAPVPPDVDRLWCMRMGLQPSGSTYLASTSSACLGTNCDTVCTSVVTGSNDYTMTFSIMVGAPDQTENAYGVKKWSYSAWVSSSVASIKISHNGNNVCRFTSSAGVGVLNPQTDRYRIMRNWNDQITSSVTGNPYTSVQVNLQREILFQRNTGSCWETFHREDVNTLHYEDTSVDGGPALDLTQSCVALNQSYYAVVDFSGSDKVSKAYYKSASMTNFETNYEQSCPESSYWTASISYTYPAGFITNDKGYYTSSIGIYKDYGLMWNVTNERKRMVDAGLVSNSAGTPSLRYPSYNSYDEYAQDIRVMGKDYSIMPEFRMSSMMAKENPYATHTDFLELPGGKTTSSVSADGALNLDFIREYSNSDFLKEFDLLMDQQEDSEGWMSVGSLSLTCKGIKKLLPYDGFYPMSRTTQLSTLFADALDYSSSVGGRNLQLYKWDKAANCFVATTEEDYTSSETLNSIRKQGITTPFFAPGIVYNSIKSGVGVGWTVVTGTCLSDTYTLQNVNTSSVSGNLSGGDFLNTVVYKDPSIAQKIDFETIYDMNKLFHKDPGKPSGTVDAAFHIDYPEALDGGFGLDLDCGLTGCSAQGENIDSPNQHFMLSWNGRNPENKISKYNQAMNNFLSECVRFFLRDPKKPETFDQGQLNYFESLPVVACNFVSGATYYMDVILEKTEAKPFTMCESGFSRDFSYTPSQFTAKDPVCRLPDFDEPCEYATWSLGPENTPPVDRSIYNTYSTFDGRYFGPATQKWKSIFNWSSASEGAHYNVSDPAQAPYTPPYYYGKSIARIKYTPGDEWTSQAFQNTNPLDIFFEKMEIEFVNTELEEKIKLGNMNYVASTTSPSASAFEDTFSTSSFAYQMAQNVGDSINLKGIRNVLETTYDGVGKLISATNTYSPGKSSWIISSKFECPILDFSNQEAQTLTVSGGLHPPTSLSSSGFLDQQPVRLGKGMWSGYGVRKGDSNFVTMGISKVDPAIISPTQIVDGVEISTSLINAFGFNNVPGQTSLHKEVGVLANKRKISEAVVAIPFTGQANIPETPGWNRAMASTTNSAQRSSLYDMLNEGRAGEVNLFAIDRKLFDQYREAPSDAELPKNSITDMVKMMNEFVLPPSMDFVQNPGIDPFVMYVFKFEQELDQVDLQDIWQGVLPSIGVKAEIEDVTIKHSLLESNEFFHKRRLPTDVRWLVFKIKKRATMEYSQVTQWNTDDVGGLVTPVPVAQVLSSGRTTLAPPTTPRIETRFSYNWPHDFYSLVELGKINTEVEFNKKLLPVSTEVDPIGKSEGTAASNADQDQSRSEGTGAQSGGTGASSQDPGSDPGDNSLGGG